LKLGMCAQNFITIASIDCTELNLQDMGYVEN